MVCLLGRFESGDMRLFMVVLSGSKSPFEDTIEMKASIVIFLYFHG